MNYILFGVFSYAPLPPFLLAFHTLLSKFLTSFEGMKKKSGACAGLCEWVINILMYYEVVTTIEPKRGMCGCYKKGYKFLEIYKCILPLVAVGFF